MKSRTPAFRAAAALCGLVLCTAGPAPGQDRPAAQQQVVGSLEAQVKALRAQLDTERSRGAKAEDDLRRLREQVARGQPPPRPDEGRAQAELREQIANARRQNDALSAAARQATQEAKDAKDLIDRERDARRRAEAVRDEQRDIARRAADEAQQLRLRVQAVERDNAVARRQVEQAERERLRAEAAAGAEIEAARRDAASAREQTEASRRDAESALARAETARRDGDAARREAQEATASADAARRQAAASLAELERERAGHWVWVGAAAVALLAGVAAGGIGTRRLWSPAPKSVWVSTSVRPGRWSFALQRAGADAVPSFALRTTMWPVRSSLRFSARQPVSMR